MLTQKRVTDRQSKDYQLIDHLYAEAFPWHEQREPPAKAYALEQPNYHLYGYFEQTQFVGFIGAWQFEDYAYIEHLAVESTLRGQGYGAQILQHFLTAYPLTILEIDPLESAAAHKRLAFYQAQGFRLNDVEHQHPAYHQGEPPHKLLVLSYPRPLTAACYTRFNAALITRVMATS